MNSISKKMLYLVLNNIKRQLNNLLNNLYNKDLFKFVIQCVMKITQFNMKYNYYYLILK